MTHLHDGTWFCSLEHAEAYKAVAHMLCDYGVVRPGLANQYSGTLRRLKNQIDQDKDGARKGLLVTRLVDHLKKNRTRRGVGVQGYSPKAGSIDDRCKARFGFTADELVSHIERLFAEGMNWERLIAGDIQIDHEIPVRVFDLTTDAGIKAAYALSNTRPMWRGDNARKCRTIDVTWLELFGEGAIRG